MTSSWTDATTDRRGFLGLAALGAAAGTGALAGCTGEARSRSAATSADKVAGVLPKFTDLSVDIPKPDIAGVRPIPDGYSAYPSGITSVISEQPGRGGPAIKAMTPAWGATPPALANNAYLQAVNAKLGTPIDFSVQDATAYADKLNAMFGARDVPDLLSIPSWEVAKIPRMTDAVKALFEDLTPYLAGDAVNRYPMLAAFPTGAWAESVWDQRLYAVPFPTDGPFPWALFHRKDLLDKQGLSYPTTIEELYEVGKKVTDPAKGVWAFNNIFAMVQMFFKVPGGKEGWGLDEAGKPVRNLETPQYRQAAEFMARLYREGLIHPDIVATRGADSKQLFASGKIVFMQDGVGAWQGMQAEQQKITKGFKIAPVPIFSAVGGDPLVWGDDIPISFCFVKKGLGKERMEEVLRVINWCSAPFGTEEAVLRDFGVQGKHYSMTPSGPVKNDLGFKENASQYVFVSGRRPVIAPTPDTPTYPAELIAYSNAMVKHLEKNPWDGVKIEWPSRFAASNVPTEDKITDVLRGRRPMSDLDGIIKEWRGNGGGDEARDLLVKALPTK